MLKYTQNLNCLDAKQLKLKPKIKKIRVNRKKLTIISPFI